MSGYIQTNQVVILPYTNTTISASDSGKTLLTPQTAGAVAVVYTLPALAAGLRYRFTNSAGAALSGSVQINAPANTLFGSAFTNNAGAVAMAVTAGGGSTSVRFVSAVSIKGDYIDLVCDGTNWYVTAVSNINVGITFA